VSELNPRVSVIIPVNRDDGFFESSLDSVLSQSFKEFELIIIANNCDDTLWERIQKISDKRVLSKRVEIGGMAFSLNLGLSISRGEYVARMDADDLCLPNRLKSQLNYLDENPTVDVLGGRVKLIDSSDNALDQSLNFYETHEEIVAVLPYRNPIAHPAVFVRKRVLIESGGYKFAYTGEDYELWIRLMLSGKKFHNLNEEILLYRRHDAQMTSNAKRNLILR